MNPFQPFTTTIQVDLDAIAANVRALRNHAGQDVEFYAVVKANAYGHGAIPVARTALASGATRLAVARPDEGIQLRKAGVASPILVMGYALPGEASALVEQDLTPTITTIEAARAFSARAASLGKAATLHLKVDSGMGRSGLLPDEVLPFVEQTVVLPGVILEGIYTHFAAADERDKSFTRQQFKIFMDVLDALRQASYTIPLRHAANSAATIDLPEMRLDAVRCGIAIYGLRPSGQVSDAVPLKPALSLISHVARVRTLPAGSSVGYGRTYVAPKPTTIALLPIGYGDGYHRNLSNQSAVLIRGQRAALVGRVSMDQISVDVTGIDGVAQDDEAVLIGEQAGERITADELARLAGTIHYEVTTGFLPRLPRVYLHGGEVMEVLRPLVD